MSGKSGSAPAVEYAASAENGGSDSDMAPKRCFKTVPVPVSVAKPIAPSLDKLPVSNVFFLTVYTVDNLLNPLF